MRAAIFEKPGAPLTIESVAPLELGPTDVLVRVTASGICHSDLGPARGALGDTGPTVLGHEGAGIVDSVGSNVSALRPGDRVIASWVAPCDRCAWCCGGQAEICAEWPHPPVPRLRRADGTLVQAGLGTLGTFAEAMIVDERALVPVATDLPDDQLALIGCGVTTGVCAVFNTAQVVPGASVAVSGLGGVGQSAIQGARIAGAATIVALDPVAMKRAAAMELGATHAIDPAAADAAEQVAALTGGRGVDYAFEASGHPAAAKQAYILVRRGGTLVLVGLQPPDAAARAAFDHGPWPRMAPAERAAVMERMVALLAERAEELAQLVTDEMGCTLAFSRAVQAGLAVKTLDYYRELAAGASFEQVRSDGSALVVEEPVGVVGAIVPWNFPQMIAMMKLGPALAAGCTVVLKPAPQTALDAYILAEVCEQSGLPPGVVSIVPAGPEAGEHLVTHPGVDKVSFTGSTAAGRRIAALCGRDIRRVTLELGGKSAAVVLHDADVDAAVAAARMTAFANAGQACVAQTRFVVHAERYGALVEGLAELAGSLVVGDPRDPAADVGPLATALQRERVESAIAKAHAEGARVVAGGGRPAHLDRGWFIEPTVLADARNDMRFGREWGPEALRSYLEPKAIGVPAGYLLSSAKLS